MQLEKYAAEFLGTFFFLAVILNAVAKNSSLAAYAPLAIGLALVAAIQFGGGISGAHLNPSVTVMFFAKGDISQEDAIGYVAAQVLGGLAAWKFISLTQAQA